MNKKIKAGIIGGAGYTGGEMLRILINHPNADIDFVHSNSNAGNYIYDVHTDLFGDTDLKFTSDLGAVLKVSPFGRDLERSVDVLFLCVGHGNAKRFLDENEIKDSIKIIDLSQDFRLDEKAEIKGRRFVYGLPELQKNLIMQAHNIANPGCFATCIQLALLPLASKKLLKSEVHINATTGSTGAGQSLSATSHFSLRNNNLSIYKAFGHQHLNEIGQSISLLQSGFIPSSGAHKVLNLIPQRGNFTRGILASMYTECDLGIEEAFKLYEDYYSNHPFTHVSKKSIDLKQVVNTNKCLIYLEKHDNKLFIVSITDNLLKGASGQAIQNMNLMFGLEETSGLKLKPAAF